MSACSPIWRPYTQEKTAPPSLKISRAEGAYLYADNGQKFFDGISSWWLTTHGHCHPRIVDAIQSQVAKLDQITFGNFTHEPAEELAELLIQITPPELKRIFFSDNGSTAVEVALKMALQACAQKGLARKTEFLAFERSYHGDTVGAMSVSGGSPFNGPYRKTLFQVLHAKHPIFSHANPDDYVRDFEKLIEQNHQSLAGVIIEPLLQGAGGMIVWPIQAVRRVSELCKRFDVYLIFDEVMTGFGRTGEVFAMNRTGVTPDLLCLSKGLTGGSLPLAVTMAGEDIYQAFLAEDRSRMLFHGHSFTGNPISCAAAVASIKIFELEGTREKLKKIEAHHLKWVEKLKQSNLLTDVRSCGTMAALDFSGVPCETQSSENKSYLSEKLSRLAATAFRNGLFLRTLGPVVYLLPPYCATSDDLESAWQILTDGLI